MKQILVACFTVLSFQMTYAQSVQKRLDSLMRFYDETFDLNCNILVAQKGRILLNKGYGYQNKERNLRNKVDAVYLIGSVTKEFTAELVLMLASEGKLSVTDKLSKYFPELSFSDSVTLENMLTHTSGIYDYTWNPKWEEGRLDTPISDSAIFSLFQNKPLKFLPNSKFSYSNTNYKLLGLIIEQVTGKSYYQNIRERIFQPLGMTHSGFDFIHLKDKNKTVGYYRVREDSFLISIAVDSTQTNAAGSMYSTTRDLFKWQRALKSYKLLNKEWQDKSYQPIKGHYGYGWNIDTVCGKRLLHHSGHIHGYNSQFIEIPGEDVCIVVLGNLMQTGGHPVSVGEDIIKVMYDTGFVIPLPRKEAAIKDEIKRRYEGKYVSPKDSTEVYVCTLKNKKLYIRFPGEESEEILLPQSETMSFIKIVDLQLEFQRNNANEYKMVLHQNGQEWEAIKK